MLVGVRLQLRDPPAASALPSRPFELHPITLRPKPAAAGFVAVRMGPTTTTVEYLGVDPETPPLFTIDITVKGGAGTGTAHTP